jgi:Ca-activated chloride channel family protein
MRFVHPEYLWLVLALPLLSFAGYLSLTRRRRALRRFAGGQEFAARLTGDVSSNRRAVKMLLLYGALVALIIAAARPQWGTRVEEVRRGGADLVVLLDTSLSMAAQDAAPSRLGQARHAIDSLLRKIEGDRVALITFAGRATLSCPLTLDHAAVRLFLETVDAEATSIPGTALREALELAVGAFGDEEAGDPERSRAILLFSDGEDHEGGIDEALDALADAGIAVHAIGTGSTRGAPIPLRDESGYKKDREGKVVTTRLDEGVLEQLALDSGGRYYRATATESEVDEIAKALSQLDEREFGAVLRSRWEERFQFPLALALLALIAETLLGDRRRSRGRDERREANG